MFDLYCSAAASQLTKSWSAAVLTQPHWISKRKYNIQGTPNIQQATVLLGLPRNICPETFAQRHLSIVTFAQKAFDPRHLSIQRFTKVTFSQTTFAHKDICP
jgi:hypothetical protein